MQLVTHRLQLPRSDVLADGNAVLQRAGAYLCFDTTQRIGLGICRSGQERTHVVFFPGTHTTTTPFVTPAPSAENIVAAR
jgi:hypothetical protein